MNIVWQPPENFAWHAFSTAQRKHAIGDGCMLRCGPILATPSNIKDGEFESSLRRWVSPKETVYIAGLAERKVDDFEVIHRSSLLQMAGPYPYADAGFDLVKVERLNHSHFDHMSKLAIECQVSPLSDSAFEMGAHFGILVGDSLVAMAGTRMRFEDWVEISGVCTKATHRGRGLATVLVRHAMRQIQTEGARSMLHVESVNVAARTLYTALGFRTVREEALIVLHRKGTTPHSKADTGGLIEPEEQYL